MLKTEPITIDNIKVGDIIILKKGLNVITNYRSYKDFWNFDTLSTVKKIDNSLLEGYKDDLAWVWLEETVSGWTSSPHVNTVVETYLRVLNTEEEIIQILLNYTHNKKKSSNG